MESIASQCPETTLIAPCHKTPKKLLPPLRGKAGMGVKTLSVTVLLTPTLTLPRQGGGDLFCDTVQLTGQSYFPIAVIHARSLDHPIRLHQDRLRNRDPERLGGLAVDDQLELRNLFYWQIRRFGSLQNPVHVAGGGGLANGV